MKKRKTRFNDGGFNSNNNPYQGDDVDPFSAVRDEEGNIKKGDIPEAEPRESVGRMEGLSEKPQTFKEAFAAARGAGNKTFEWQGKRYTTEMAGAKKAASAPAAASYSNEGRSRPTATATKAPSSIYDTSRDPLLRKISESMKEKREAAAELRRESRRGQASAPTKERREDPYTGRTAVERMKDLRGYAGGGSVKSASKRADGIATRGKTKCKVY